MIIQRILVVALALLCSGAFAQTWPTRTIHVIVPYAAGGAMDLTARSLAAVMSETIGQSVVVENRTGGGGLIGTD